MTRDDIIRMAQQAAGVSYPAGMAGVKIGMSEDHIERFAALVAAAEREGMEINSIHSCHSECQRPICVLVREAVKAEREACAKVVDEAGYRYEFRANLPDHLRDITLEAGRIAPMVCLNVAAKIRARGSNV